METSHTSITGPKAAPTRCVPNFCEANSRISTTSAMTST